MNEQEAILLNRYLKYIRKRRICLCSIIILIVIGIAFYNLCNKDNFAKVENTIEDKNEINIINESNISFEENTPDKIVEENQEEFENKITNENIISESKEETSKSEETKEISISNKQKENQKKLEGKPANKDFLFTDGYTMENVTQAAQEYLKSYNCSGECVPIKDNEGIYLGMRVIFY